MVPQLILTLSFASLIPLNLSKTVEKLGLVLTRIIDGRSLTFFLC